MTDKPTLLGISGALRRESSNTRLMREGARLFGDCTWIEADLRLPLYDGDLETSEGIPGAVQTLADRIAQADGVLISGPEYNKSISGVLKNALDWVSRVKGNPWKGKPVAIMSSAAGRSGGETGQYMLRHALAPFSPRFALSGAVTLGDGRNQFDENGRLTNERAERLLTNLMEALRVEIDVARHLAAQDG